MSKLPPPLLSLSLPYDQALLPRLPIDVLFLIAHHLSVQHALAVAPPADYARSPPIHKALVGLASLSRSIRPLVLPLLYRHCIVRSAKSVLALREILDSNPSLGACVRHLDVFVREVQEQTSQIWTEVMELCLRRMERLENLRWDAEMLPTCSVVETLVKLGTVRELEVDCRVFWAGCPELSGLTTLRSFTLSHYDAHLTSIHFLALFESLASVAGRGDNEERKSGRLLKKGASLESEKGSAENRDCAEDQRSLGLRHLSLSTSGVTYLHSPRLLHLGAWSSLESLDIYPLDPSPPLADSLASAGASLKRLRIVLDVTPVERAYDDLWRALVGRLPRLEELHVDPFPQLNTAPSFFTFARKCTLLRLVNGKPAEEQAMLDQVPQVDILQDQNLTVLR